ncbi:DUF6634 family protein [Devosia sp. LjRoot3]|uniref:DUF6634 family protein n=1 Tax=Devosia sp. LjRoot3 TaxID=3342319 RepID=UPI003ECFE136
MSIDFLGYDPLATADQLARAAYDLAELAAGHPPDPLSMSEAPLLRRWGAIRAARPALTGVIYGHPELEDGKTVVTSGLLAINRQAGWARTHSRFYLLGAASLFGLDA